MNTPIQHKGLSKLLGLNYKIEYKKGVENKVVDALSTKEGHVETVEGESKINELSRGEGQNRKIEEERAVLHMVSELIPQWVEEIKSSYEGDSWIESLKAKICSSKEVGSSHHLNECHGVLRYKGRVCVGTQGNWRQ